MTRKEFYNIDPELKRIGAKAHVFYNYRVMNPKKESEIAAFRMFYDTEYSETPKRKLSDDEVRTILAFIYHSETRRSRSFLLTGLIVLAFFFAFIAILILI